MATKNVSNGSKTPNLPSKSPGKQSGGRRDNAPPKGKK